MINSLFQTPYKVNDMVLYAILNQPDNFIKSKLILYSSFININIMSFCEKV